MLRSTTVLYVYDANKIESHYQRLSDAFKTVKNIKIHFAVKALSNINVLKFL